MGQLLPPMSLLLLVVAGMRAADLQKAKLLLDPIWDRVLRRDSVTLKCQGAHPTGNSSTTQWWHNDSLIPNEAPSYFIAAAEAPDSGEYRCQTGLSALSDPVRLDVHTSWLLLQAPQWVFQEGDPIRLRCHSWMNRTMHKVQYFQNGIGRMFFHNNSEFHIPKAALKHSGSYFCRGIIGTKNESSEAVNITVQATSSISAFFLPWHQVMFCLVMGLLFAVDTGLYFSVQRDLRRLVKDRRSGKVTWSQDS
ncbi:Low affinity immunoglobulin gamma Fc region receptor III-A [Manis javanica]|nr:Low affinity immunoglobulin gamma Fc region receptor III-A [Manis javanica]